MGRKTIYSKAEQPNRLNRISPATNTVFHILLLIFAVLCIVPLVLVFMVSVSSAGVPGGKWVPVCPKLLFRRGIFVSVE